MFRHFHGHGDFGPSRFFAKGNLKYVILDLVKDNPSHGYEIIRKLKESFARFLFPRAGSVYPTLQLLEDMGYIKATEQDGKKVYAITDEGKKYLQEHEETIRNIKEHIHGRWGASGLHEEFHDIILEFRSLARELVMKGRSIEPEKMTRIREILKKAKQDMKR